MAAKKKTEKPKTNGVDKKGKIEMTREDAGPSLSSESLLRRIPALGEYIRRIGAEELNFKKFMIREYNEVFRHYYTEKTIISINDDGTIYCSRAEHAPTKEEADAIQHAWVNGKIKLPKSVTTTIQNAKKKQAELEETMKKMGAEEGSAAFIFVNRGDGKVKMIQQTVRLKGEKKYYAHSWWGDGEWRTMEPEGRLPIWKPYATRNKTKLMIHEGAKCALFIDDLLHNEDRKAEREAHPWISDLEDYEHWGMIGGALAPGRTDYSEITKESYEEVVYVCDNDFPGKTALQEVARNYTGLLFGIMFGGDFKDSFDLADPLPEKLFAEGSDGKRRWMGPTLKQIMIPATRATEIIPPADGKGKGTVQLTRAFRKMWTHSVVPEVYMHMSSPHIMLSGDEFNNAVRPFSDVDNTARLLKQDASSKSYIIRYDPSRKPGPFTDKDGTFINTYKASDIAAKKGDPTPFIDFMEHLIPDKGERHEVYRWITTLISRPDIRMNYALLLISEMQGVGKGTLAEKILTPLIGHLNVSSPSENDIVDSQFNSWQAHKRLAVIHEIYSGHSRKAYNRLKSVLTEDIITINKKHIASYETQNWTHIFACSNSLRAILIGFEDRRWYIPRVTEEKKPQKYWAELNRWLKEEGGLSIIKWWSDKFVEKDHVKKGEDAKPSELKKRMSEEGDSPGQDRVRGLLRRIKAIVDGTADDSAQMTGKWKAEGQMTEDGKVIILDKDLVNYIKDVVHNGRQSDNLEKPMTIRRLAKSEEWYIGEERVNYNMNSWGAEAQGARIITNDYRLSKLAPSEIGGKKANGSVPPLKPLKFDWAKTI